MIFQDPSASLNPRRRVGEIIAEPLVVHARLPTGPVFPRRLRELIGHSRPARHLLSTATRTNSPAGSASASALPGLWPSNRSWSSPTSRCRRLTSRCRRRSSTSSPTCASGWGSPPSSWRMISAVVRQVSERTAVMYLGAIVEIGPTQAMFHHPAHPYTQALLSAIPVPSVDPARKRQRIILKGEIPSPINPPSGCRFHPRCPMAQDRCKVERPALLPIADGRRVACHFPLSM